MLNRTNYYTHFPADYSKPDRPDATIREKLVTELERITALRETPLPSITTDYSLEAIEQENKDWWCTRCEAIRSGRGDLLAAESAEEFVYLCQDGPFYGAMAADKVVAGWCEIFFQPGATMIWPVVMFHGETIFFEWLVLDDHTHETIASGNVTFLRRGHRGGCYVKTEHLNFYRNVAANFAVI